MENMGNTAKAENIKDKKNRYILSMMFFVILVGTTFYLLLKDCNFGDIADAVRGAEYSYLFLSVVMAIIYISGEGQCLNIIVKSLKGKASKLSCFTYGCIDFYFCAVTPSATGGQPVAAYYMAKDGVSVSTSTIALLLNTIQYKVVLLVLGIIVMVFKFGDLFGDFWFTFMFIFGVVANIITVGFCLTAVFSKALLNKIVYKSVNFLVKIKIIRNRRKALLKYEHHFKDYACSAEYIKSNPAVNVKVFFVCLVQRLALFSIAYFIYRSFGSEGSSFFDLLAIQVAVAMAVDSLPLPGGVGAAEAFTLELFTTIYGVGKVATATLLTRGISYYFCLLVSGAFFVANHIRLIKVGKRQIKKGEL